MKKVLFISDYNLTHTPGGAQRSNAILIEKGRSLGYSILEANYNFNFKVCDFNEYDILISSNLEGIYRLNPDIISKISEHKNHVRLEHDLNKYLLKEDREKLFKSCKKTIFLTNYHHNLFKKLYGNIFNGVNIVYDPIDINLFKDENLKRENKVLYVGYMHELKGTLAFFEFVLSHPDMKFVVAGWGQMTFDFLARNIPNVEYLGAVNYEDMPKIYNKYDVLYYSPVLPEPFCRSVAEAAICGMKMISNSGDIIGCLNEMSEIGQEKFKEICQNAPETFWKVIDD
jgi:glycosyltransferase involved in cell wall biosynthesis